MRSTRVIPPTLKMRQRNNAEEKFLDKRLVEIEADYRAQNAKLITEIAELKNTLTELNLDGGDHCLEYFSSPDDPSKLIPIILPTSKHGPSLGILKSWCSGDSKSTEAIDDNSSRFPDYDNVLHEDVRLVDSGENPDRPEECVYGSGVRNIRCQYFPCAVPRGYDSIGYQLITRDYPDRVVASNNPQVTNGTCESGQKTDIALLQPGKHPGFQERTVKQGRPSIREKVRSLKQVLDERKRKLAEMKPKAWETNYGNPVPLRRIMNPLRPAPTDG